MAESGLVMLTYNEMEDNCAKLVNLISEVTEESNSIQNIVKSFEGASKGQSKEVFEEDYRLMVESINTTIEAMNEVTELIQHYIADMRELEEAYGRGPHVTKG